jgi:hypothetical protein
MFKMEKIRINHKKAQVASTLTWFVGFLVIFFIMLLFLALTVVIAGAKEIGKSSKNEVQKYNSASLESQRTLISFLNTPVEGGKMREEILSSLNILIENNIDIYNIHYENLNPDTKYLVDLNKQKLISQIQGTLDKVCSEYMLKVPQGIIMNDVNDFISESKFESGGWKETLLVSWTNWVTLKISYKDKMIEIKYRQLKKCQ